MYLSQLFAVSLATAILVPLDVGAYTFGGAPLAAATTTASVLALSGWVATRHRRSGSGPVAFNLYVATVVSLLVLYAEQWSRGFPSKLVRLFPGSFPHGVGLSDHAFVGAFPLAGSALLVLGALAYLQGSPIGWFAAWFTFAWGAVAALAVYVYPLFGTGGVFPLPGTFTAPLPLVASLFGIRAMLRADTRPSTRPVPGRSAGLPAPFSELRGGERT
ncbi:MAG TPA: hypothetical protein VFW03_28075 [Gemmatimonadaceae bacterium]|nr:hypothetical protein [Gemmatimonadaceae bacterium]